LLLVPYAKEPRDVTGYIPFLVKISKNFHFTRQIMQISVHVLR